MLRVHMTQTEGELENIFLVESVLNPTYPLNELAKSGLGIAVKLLSRTEPSQLTFHGEEIFIPISQIALIKVVEEQ